VKRYRSIEQTAQKAAKAHMRALEAAIAQPDSPSAQRAHR